MKWCFKARVGNLFWKLYLTYLFDYISAINCSNVLKEVKRS